MNCFRHPNEVAAAFCKSCTKPLCLVCCRQAFGGITHVCSEACARAALQKAAPEDSEELADGFFARAYAKFYLSALVVVLGGISGGYFFGLQASAAIDRIKHPPRLLGYASASAYHDPRNSIYRILYDWGITDWRALFGIGAVIGIGVAVLYLKVGGKIMILVCVLAYLLLSLWTAWT